MAYTIDGIDILTYGIRAGHSPGGNIALSGCFDMPERIGPTERDWGDTDGVEPYVDTDEIFLAGRDIKFNGSIFGSHASIYTNLQNFRTTVDAATGLKVFATPYGTFNVMMRSLNTIYHEGGASITMLFREPVVSASGVLPASGVDNNSIGSIPFTSFGFYVTKKAGIVDIPELKPMQFTIYSQEGYQPVKRFADEVKLNGFILADDLADFESKVNSFHSMLSASGTKELIVNGVTMGRFFAKSGFKVENVIIFSNG